MIAWNTGPSLLLVFTVPKKEPKNVQANTANEDNMISVQWDLLPCMSGQPYIAGYLVQYCPVMDQTQLCNSKVFFMPTIWIK